VNPLRKLAGQTAVYGISSIIGRFLNYLLVPFYTRIFSTEQYGIVTEMYAYVAFLIVILTYGMETAFFRFSSQTDSKENIYSTTLISIFSTSIFFIIIATFFSETIGQALGYPDHTEYVIWFAIIVGLDAIASIPLARLRQLNKAAVFMGVNLANIGINLGFNIFFLVYCRNHFEQFGEASNMVVKWLYNPDIGVGYVFISNLIASIFKLAILAPYMLNIKMAFDFMKWKEMLWYALPLMVLGFAGIVNETIDRVMLKHLLPMPEKEALEQIGIYGANYKIAMLMMLFIQAYRFAAEPFFFGHEKEKDAKEVYAKLMNYFIAFCLFIFLVITLFKEVVVVFVGQDFRSGSEVITILLAANLCFGIVYNLSIWYKLSNKTSFGAIISIFGAVLTIMLNYVFIPIYGYMGSAWATLICYFIMMLLSYYFGQKYYPIDYPLKKVFLYILLTVLFYVLNLWMINDFNLILSWGIKLLLLASFVAFVVKTEKIRLPNLNK
jgi:O-antigen/teichoic acid export membrane protein